MRKRFCREVVLTRIIVMDWMQNKATIREIVYEFDDVFVDDEFSPYERLYVKEVDDTFHNTDDDCDVYDVMETHRTIAENKFEPDKSTMPSNDNDYNIVVGKTRGFQETYQLIGNTIYERERQKAYTDHKQWVNVVGQLV